MYIRQISTTPRRRKMKTNVLYILSSSFYIKCLTQKLYKNPPILIDTSHAHVCMISDSINEILPKMAIFGTFWPFYAIFHSTVWSRGKKNVLIMFVLWRPVDRYATWMCRCACSNYYSHYLINKKMAFLHPVFLAFLEK